jgi:hypothetical protein
VGTATVHIEWLNGDLHNFVLGRASESEHVQRRMGTACGTGGSRTEHEEQQQDGANQGEAQEVETHDFFLSSALAQESNAEQNYSLCNTMCKAERLDAGRD